MKRSKLEMHVEILKVLAQSGPLKFTHIMCQANMNGDTLKEYLVFLIKQGIIEEVVLEKNSAVYANTNHGAAVLRFFGQLDKTLPTKEESNSFPYPIETEN